MTDPISGATSRKPNASYGDGDDAICREQPQGTTAAASTAKTASSSATPVASAPTKTASSDEAIAKLPARDVDYSRMVVASAPEPKRTLAKAPAAETPKPTNNNQERTTARDGIAPYAAMGRTSGGDAFAGAAALKGRDPKSGLEVEMLTASLQRGWQNEVQVGVARLGGSSDDGRRSGTVDFATARVSGGIHNSDGSTGINFGANAILVAVEATHPVGEAGSVTGGAGFGVGGEVSLGFKKEGPHAKLELCVRVAADPTVEGVCIKTPW